MDSCTDIIIISLFRDKKFKKEDAFIGYQKDTPAAAVFQATNQMEKLCQRDHSVVQKWTEVLRSGLLGFTLDDVADQNQEMVRKIVFCDPDCCHLWRQRRLVVLPLYTLSTYMVTNVSAVHPLPEVVGTASPLT